MRTHQSSLNLKGNISREAIMEAVKKLECYELPIYYQDESEIFQNLSYYKALAFNYSGRVYAVMNRSFIPLQHSEVMEKTFQSLDDTGLRYQPVRFTVNDYDRKNSISASIIFPDLRFNVDGSDVFASLDVSNGNDGCCTYHRDFGFYRQICQNGMAVSVEQLFCESRKHTKNIEIAPISEVFDQLADYVPKFKELLEKAQSIALGNAIMKNLVKAYELSPSFVAKLPEIWNRYQDMVQEQVNLNTVWGIYQVMSNYITNHISNYSISRARVMSKQLTAWLIASVSEYYGKDVTDTFSFQTDNSIKELANV